MGKSSAIVVALVGVGAAAGLFVASSKAVPGKGPSPEQLKAVALQADGLLREAAAGVHSRATTLAELPRLVAAVATDAATVKDLTTEELAFRVKPGETIEIGQVYKDGHVEVLLKIPEDMTMSPPLDKPGVHVMRAGDKLVVSEVVTVKPTQRADELSGALAVSQEIDVTALGNALDGLGAAGGISVGDVAVVTGTRARAAGATPVNGEQPTVGGGVVKVTAEVTPASTQRSTGLLGGAAAAVVLGLIGAAVLLARKPSTGAAAAPETMASAQPSTGQVVITPGVGGTPPRVSRAQDVPAEAGGEIARARTEFSGNTPMPERLSQGLPAQPPAGQSPGRFGRYTLLKTLGAGGMAEVYLARASGEAGFEKLVALKIMHRNLATQEKVVDLFLDEARLVSRLTHPNILQIADLGKAGDDYFIAMEYIDGSDLDRLVKSSRARGQQVPLRVGLTILRKICDGLHAAHMAKDESGRLIDLVHRDVKAENVLCSKAGAVKVGDFGIAKANQQVHKTQLGELKGTAAYMAPEHRTGQAVDRRADVYGVGAIAYEVLTGHEVNLDLAMLAHLGRQGWPHLKPPSQVRPDLPAEIDTIVFKALAYEKEDRYATCEAFEEALEAVSTRFGLTASDKVVAQWVESEIAAMPSSSSPAQGAAG